MKSRILLVFALLSFLGLGEAFAQDSIFSKETYTTADMTLPYRKANIPGYGDKPLLVLYLHGGSSRGDDNELQMQEPAVDSISTWLSQSNRKAIMVVPQCPADKMWNGTTLDVVVGLLQTFVDRGVVDGTKIYVLGGSMGGTGTWTLLSNYPDFFAAAMPVAGNPLGTTPSAVAKTPLYTVMGTDDKVMKLSNVESFVTMLEKNEAEYKFDIEEGWTHEDVCQLSYTAKRLNWLFQHAKQTTEGINGTVAGEREAVKVVWYSISGQQMASAPVQRGIYLKSSLYDDGSVTSEKFYIR